MDVSNLQIAFPPADGVQVTLAVKSGSQTLAEVPMTLFERQGNLAKMKYQRSSFVSLGTDAGPRSIEITAGEKLAGKLDFELTKKQGGDPLVPKVEYGVKGPWSRYGYVTYEIEDDGRNDIYANYWMSKDDLSAGNARFVCYVRQGTKVIAESRQRSVSGPGYTKQLNQLFKPGNNVFTKADLASLNGQLVFEVKEGSRLLRKWLVQVSGGEFTPHSRSSLTGTKPELYLAPRRLAQRGVDPKLLTWMIQGG